MSADDEHRIVVAAQKVAGSVPIVLAGSRASGRAERGSDWDVVVVVPLWRLPFLVRPLAACAEELSRELGAPVSLNPMPVSRFRRVGENLFVWKLAREGRALAAPGGFALPEPGRPPVLSGALELSYLASALLWIVEADDDRARAKAARHLAQLRLLRAGEYDPAPPASTGDVLASVLAELDAVGCPYGVAASLRRNVVYLLLSALRGRLRLRAAWSTRAIDCRLLVAAAAVATGRDPLLPAGISGAARDAILREWPSAHPLLAL